MELQNFPFVQSINHHLCCRHCSDLSSGSDRGPAFLPSLFRQIKLSFWFVNKYVIFSCLLVLTNETFYFACLGK